MNLDAPNIPTPAPPTTNRKDRSMTAQPWIDPADLIGELADIDTLTADVFDDDIPLRDRVAALVADWNDTTTLVDDPRYPWDERMAADKRQTMRRGVA